MIDSGGHFSNIWEKDEDQEVGTYIVNPVHCRIKTKKKRKNEIRFDPLRPVDPLLIEVLMKWVSSDGELKTIRVGISDLSCNFFLVLIQTRKWLTNEVMIGLVLNFFF